MASDKITQTSDSDFESDVLKSSEPVLVDFWAEWCGPCRSLAPILDELADEYEGKLKVVKVNVDDHKEAAAQYGVRGIPTMIFFKSGQQMEALVGNQPKEILKEKIDQLIG